jgi:hypothetical protein
LVLENHLIQACLEDLGVLKTLVDQVNQECLLYRVFLELQKDLLVLVSPVNPTLPLVLLVLYLPVLLMVQLVQDFH